MQIILASNSPRRKELLSQIGIDYKVIPANVDENIDEKDPKNLVMALSKRKANSVYQANKGQIILAADTVVAFNDKILGKPANKKDAFDMLTMLSGQIHQVYTGVTIINPSGDVDTFYESTDVEMFVNTEETINQYIETGEPMDKAGAYGIQGKGAILVQRIHGDYNNVVGLPLAAVYKRLSQIQN